MRAGHDLIVFSHLRWTFVWQRPQHLISRMKVPGRVWFIEEPVSAEVAEPRLAIEDRGAVTRVWLEVPDKKPHIGFGAPEASPYGKLLDQLLWGVADPVVWLYTPMALDLAQQRKPALLVYDVMDDLASFKWAPESLRLRYLQSLDSSDIVFAGGRSLFHKVLKHRPDETFLFPSGVEPEHYADARRHRKAGGPPVAGYVGVIDERIDLDLVRQLGQMLPEWEIHMVGPTLKLDPASLPDGPNLKYLGHRAYEELPEAMGGFDVGIMPFALNEATKSISPTKTLEYLAAGLPVVSTKVPDVVADFAEVVALCDGAPAFADACRLALLQGQPPQVEVKVSSLLETQHWNTIASEMERLVEERLGNGRRARSLPGKKRFDYLVVGAGFAGSVIAERLATQAGKSVLLVDKRPHIGGNAYDYYDEAGVLVHRYGPHIFHTNSSEVFDYLSQFTAWRPYEHRVRASVDGRLVPIPINLDTINELYGMNLTSLEVDDFFKSVAEPVVESRTSEDVVVGKVGRELYEKFFRNYTRKQWGLDPSELDASVTSRVPTRTNRDDRYFTDKYQAMPLHGYTRMFENMLHRPGIKIMLNTDYREIEDVIPWDRMVYTGPIDEFFGYRFGRLPYRSLDFRFESFPVEVRQSAPVINYPNDHPYTRVTEFKYLTGQECPNTTLVYEYPQDEGDPYYPVPRPENAELYKRYKALADATPEVHFAGRLATYKYYNMDQVTAQALSMFARLQRSGHGATVVDENRLRAASGEGFDA
ncbi:MAG: UDP-galactopyranose mutase [Actinomycetota bacterium]|nr:UDP-galactopyranose mutase [Actinomycetota bacterium]